MKIAFALKVLAIGTLLGLAGCSSTKALQKDVENLKLQMAKVQADTQSAQSAADAAAAAAQSAGQMASGAQSSANQAFAGAQASQSCCSAVDEKIERVFERAIAK